VTIVPGAERSATLVRRSGALPGRGPRAPPTFERFPPELFDKSPTSLNSTVPGSPARHVLSRIATAPIFITVAPAPLAVATSVLPRANYRSTYQTTLSTTGGTGQTAWALVGGALPSGLSLASNASISGAPMAVGTFGFTVRPSDAGWAGNVARAMRLSRTCVIEEPVPSYSARLHGHALSGRARYGLPRICGQDPAFSGRRDRDA
jgi:hypothetical protein